MRLKRILVALLFSSLCKPAFAAGLDVPIHVHAGDGQAADCMTSRVSGLNPHGDNFLSVRSGPAGSFRELDRLHNGEVVTIYEMHGAWAGVVYRTVNPACYSPVTRPITLPRKGWISTKWLVDVAG